MISNFTLADKAQIKKDIENKYLKVAVLPEGQFRYPTGREALETLGYDPDILITLPGSVANSYCGTGNPFSHGEIGKGETILDFGCGAGVDTLIAAKIVGNRGKAIGLDIIPKMLEKAIENKNILGLTNVDFIISQGDKLEFADEYFDTIISNSVINLVPEKESILKELYRCMKPGGRLLLVDQIFTGEQIKQHDARVKSWFQWEGGAVPGKVFLEMLKDAGFTHLKLIGETGFNSSPKTKGTLISGRKPLASECCKS